MKKQNATCATEAKEEKEQKQFGKTANKGDSSRVKPGETKTQEKKADSAVAQRHNKECSVEEEEECEDE